MKYAIEYSLDTIENLKLLSTYNQKIVLEQVEKPLGYEPELKRKTESE